MTELQKKLAARGEAEYAAFTARLVPTVPRERILGVRVPVLRDFAKAFEKTDACADFLCDLPHDFHEENLLHAILLCRMKDFDAAIAAVDAFLPHVDNWAVCDTLRPRVFAKRKPELLKKAYAWTENEATYPRRFGIGMLMSHFLDGDFTPAVLARAAAAENGEYYVNMMVAWFFATALAKQWDETLPYLTGRRLSPWVHAKTVQKACESFRITPEQKEFLRSL